MTDSAIVIEAKIWPPSVNATWRHVAGKPMLSKKTRLFRLAMKSHIASLRAKGLLPKEPLTTPLAVSITLFPPNRGKRDIDNYQKTVFDVLTLTGVWQDDSQVQRMSVAFGEPVRGGAFQLEIVKIPPCQNNEAMPLLS